MLRQVSNVILQDRISTVELRKRLQLNSLKEYLQLRRLLWYGHLKEWRRVPGPVNVESLRLICYLPELPQGYRATTKR